MPDDCNANNLAVTDKVKEDSTTMSVLGPTDLVHPAIAANDCHVDDLTVVNKVEDECFTLSALGPVQSFNRIKRKKCAYGQKKRKRSNEQAGYHHQQVQVDESKDNVFVLPSVGTSLPIPKLD